MAHLITGLIFIPILGALFISVVPRNYARAVALGSTAITALLALTVWRHFDPTAAGLQMIGRHRWIPAIGAEVLLGIDGLSLLLVLLTSLIFPFALLAQRMGRGFCALMLVMQAALYGTFTAQNFILWFLFYEMSLIPGFLLIKVWGGANRDRAATKFFLYTFLGSIAMLLSFLGIYFVRGTFDFAALTALGKEGLSREILSGLPSPESSSGSRSRCRSSPFTPGCRTLTNRHRSAPRWSSPASSQRWVFMDLCDCSCHFSLTK